MGLLRVTNGRRRYTLELELHSSTRKSEMPVEKQHAIFLETRGLPTSAEELSKKLALKIKTLGGLIGRLENAGSVDRTNEIIQRARESGTELWIGDVEPTDKESYSHFLNAFGIVAAGATGGYLIGKAVTTKPTRREFLGYGGLLAGAAAVFGSGILLNRKGDASTRILARESLKVTRHFDQLVTVRNAIMAHKIQALAEKTGHTNIGITIGANHANMADLLEQGVSLTPEARREIAARGPAALKMYRCVYDKKASKWRVEELSL